MGATGKKLKKRKDHHCKECDKYYSSKQALGNHMIGGLKDHRCDVCGRSFGLKGKLYKHAKAVHLGIKDKGSKKRK